ncbi:MAG: right-handed parallel beta-helix repeat-containing protein [Sphingobacteriales bacterium]|nr:MAG: right-handed parallel beta-helix repeat-containing protein [Sphingobacteriales bacterium]
MNKFQHKVFTVLGISLFLSTSAIQAAEIFVSPSGNNQNSGTKAKPLASVDAALRQARELRRLNDPSVKGGVQIILRGGTYALYEPLFIRPEDSGTAESPTTIAAAKGEMPVLSGGINITGWKKAGTVANLPKAAQGNVWVADAPVWDDDLLDFRQLWVNGQKAVRAKSVNGSKMNRILSWNHKDQTCQIPLPSKDFKHTPGLEMLIHQWWAIANLRVKAVEVKGDSAKLTFHQPESKVQSEHPWPAPWVSKETGNSGFFLTNTISFLDEQGEWFLDKASRKIYYWPRSGETINKVNVVAPAIETLVKIEGTIDLPVKYVNFNGISFNYTTWMRPSKKGHVPLQSGMYLLDAYKLKTPGTPDKAGLENQAWVGRPAAAVEATYTANTSFTNCHFQHLSSTGLDYKRGNYQDKIEGNLFKDIGGTAIQVGVYSDESFEAHLPYHPQDQREISRSTHISNNLITDVTNEDWGCLGISAGFVKGINITNNEINEVSYTGIAVGWGWTKTLNAMSNNRVHANKIHHYGKHMYDVAAVYTLSAQPGSSITENYIDSIYTAPYAHLPEHWFYLYTDEGTAYYTVKDNWCPAEKFLQNANGPNNIWTNNGPMVKDSIKNSAGLEKAYQHLLKYKAPADTRWAINKFTGEQKK